MAVQIFLLKLICQILCNTTSFKDYYINNKSLFQDENYRTKKGDS